MVRSRIVRSVVPALFVLCAACSDAAAPDSSRQEITLSGTSIDNDGVPRTGWTVVGEGRADVCDPGQPVVAGDTTSVDATGRYALTMSLPLGRRTCVSIEVSTTLVVPGEPGQPIATGGSYRDAIWYCTPPAACKRGGTIVIQRPGG